MREKEKSAAIFAPYQTLKPDHILVIQLSYDPRFIRQLLAHAVVESEPSEDNLPAIPLLVLPPKPLDPQAPACQILRQHGNCAVPGRRAFVLCQLRRPLHRRLRNVLLAFDLERGMGLAQPTHQP